MTAVALVDVRSAQGPGTSLVVTEASADVSISVEQHPTSVKFYGTARAMMRSATQQWQKQQEFEATAGATVIVKSGLEPEIVPSYDGPDGFDLDDFVPPFVTH